MHGDDDENAVVKGEFHVGSLRGGSPFVPWAMTTTVRKEVVAQSVGIPIMCKYVRREIRSLTRDDRERVLDALAIVHKMPLLEGRAKYGGKFFDATDQHHLSIQMCELFAINFINLPQLSFVLPPLEHLEPLLLLSTHARAMYMGGR